MTHTEAAPSPYLTGLMEPVHDERDDHDLVVTGTLPDGLQGLFLRNGPNPQFAPIGTYHPFDGDGMLHAVDIDGGRARYRNRWIESAGLRAERARGAAQYGGMSTFTMVDPEVMAEGGIIKNTGNTHTVRHGGRLLALLEVCPPTEIDPTDLHTVGEYDFGGRLAGGVTAHPKVDPVSGELVFFGYSPIPPFLRYHVADASGALVHTAEIDLPRPVMIHDVAVTEKHTVFWDAPAVFDMASYLGGGPMLRWDPEAGTRIGVLPRYGTNADVRWFDVDDHYVVHVCNAWDDGDTLRICAPRFDRAPGALAPSAETAPNEPVPWSWTIDLAAGTVRDEQIDDRPGEFPRVNDDHATRPTRYLYNARRDDWDIEFEFSGVIKYDTATGASTEYSYGPGTVSGEHAFAPDPDGTAEDDGWLLSMVADKADGSTHLAVVDARDVAAGPVARVHIPRRVPLGFHANWFPA